MKTRLSTPLTYLYKVGLAAIFAGFAIFMIAVSLGYQWRKPEGRNSPMTLLARAGYLLVGLGGFYWAWQFTRLKRVETDDTSLYVSNYRTETQIPFTEIAEVRETSPYWFTVVITLKNPSRFGRVVVFRPRHRIYLSGLHPVTRQLLELVDLMDDCRNAQVRGLPLHPAAGEGRTREQRSKS